MKSKGSNELSIKDLPELENEWEVWIEGLDKGGKGTRTCNVGQEGEYRVSELETEDSYRISMEEVHEGE